MAKALVWLAQPLMTCFRTFSASARKSSELAKYWLVVARTEPLMLKFVYAGRLTTKFTFVFCCYYSQSNNIHEKNTLFWLAESRVQFNCITGAKSVTPVQITHRNFGLWLAAISTFWKSILNSKPFITYTNKTTVCSVKVCIKISTLLDNHKFPNFIITWD